MKIHLRQRHLKPGMTRLQALACLCGFGFLAFIWLAVLFLGKWKVGSDRSSAIMNVRNCQQAMRGYQCMESVAAGDPFAEEHLEEFMPYPDGHVVIGGRIDYDNAGVMCGESGYPAKNDDHLWLKIIAPETVGNVGKYGFADIADATDW